MKYTVAEMFGKLPLSATQKWPLGVWDIQAFEKAGVKLVFFAPRGEDYQTVHDRDEFYFIAQGSGEIVIGQERHSFQTGDAYFVERGVEHRFEKFTDDFATWAIFF